MGLHYNNGKPLSKLKMRQIANEWQPWRTVATWVSVALARSGYRSNTRRELRGRGESERLEENQKDGIVLTSRL